MATLHQLETLTPQIWARYNAIRSRPDYWTTGDKTLLKRLSNMRCPRCGAENCKPYGRNSVGNDRYKCRHCFRTFTKNARVYTFNNWSQNHD